MNIGCSLNIYAIKGGVRWERDYCILALDLRCENCSVVPI